MFFQAPLTSILIYNVFPFHIQQQGLDTQLHHLDELLHYYQEKGGGHALSDLIPLSARGCCNCMLWSDFRVHKERKNLFLLWKNRWCVNTAIQVTVDPLRPCTRGQTVCEHCHKIHCKGQVHVQTWGVCWLKGVVAWFEVRITKRITGKIWRAIHLSSQNGNLSLLILIF